MTNSNKERIGIIAGSGRLPALLVAACHESQRPYSLVGISGAADVKVLGEEPSLWMRLGEAAKGFAHLRITGAKDIVVAGKVMRPTLSELMPDWRTAKFLTRVGARAFVQRDAMGDDKLLRAIIAEIELEGFRVVGVDSLLPDLSAQAGALGSVVPTEQDKQDIAKGLLAAKELGRKDVGQAVAVHNGSVVGTEGEAGTDSLVAGLKDIGDNGRGPILVKAMKPNQDRRADLPAIGPDTVEACVAAGFRGIAIEAANTLVIDRALVAKKADEAGLFVFGVDGKTDAP